MMITDADKHLIRESFALVAPMADAALDLFYQRLFELKPEYRALFPDDMHMQREKLRDMLAYVVESLDFGDDSALTRDLRALGQRHRVSYRVPDSAYEPVGTALLDTLARGLGDAFDAPTRAAWTRLYGQIVDAMKWSHASVRPPVAEEHVTGTRIRMQALDGDPLSHIPLPSRRDVG